MSGKNRFKAWIAARREARTARAAARADSKVHRGKFPISWALFVGALACSFGSVLLEHPHGYLDAETWVAFLRELGFAFLIAWGIANFIDRHARQREEKAASEDRGRIARDVIHAVFGLQHDNKYVRKVVEHTLQPRIVRDRLESEYIVEPLTPDEEAELGIAQSGRFVKLTMIARTSFMNVATYPVDHDVKYAFPVRAAPKLREYARLVSVTLGDDPMPQKEIDAGEIEGADEAFKVYSWKRRLEGQGRLECVFHAVCLKELSDNEVWGTYLAIVKGLAITTHVRLPNMHFGLRALTATDVKQRYKTPTSGSWTIDGPILPNESVVFWWRSPEDDGLVAEATSTVAATSTKSGKVS